MKSFPLIVLVFASSLGGCVSSDSPSSEGTATVGSDKDLHGCVGSAGYQWCERTAECVRSWELANTIGFENTPEGFESYCRE